MKGKQEKRKAYAACERPLRGGKDCAHMEKMGRPKDTKKKEKGSVEGEKKCSFSGHVHIKTDRGAIKREKLSSPRKKTFSRGMWKLDREGELEK